MNDNALFTSPGLGAFYADLLDLFPELRLYNEAELLGHAGAGRPDRQRSTSSSESCEVGYKLQVTSYKLHVTNHHQL